MNEALSQYKCNIDLWISFKPAWAMFCSVVRQAKADSWHEFLSHFPSGTTSDVWKHVRTFRSSPRSRQIVLAESDHYISDPLLLTEAVAVHFSGKSSGATADPFFAAHRTQVERTPITFSADNSPAYNSPFTLSELSHAISNSTSRSPGLDRFPCAFLHHISITHQCNLLSFFNFLFCSGYPDQWHTGVVTPIGKPFQCRTRLISYRFITLTDCLSKDLSK